MMVCDFCVKNILESGKAWDYHQKSYEHLKKAADELCVFCSSLHRDVDRFRDISSVDASSWPVQRWSVRTPGRIRESRESVLVTFRPVPRSGGDHDREGIEGNGQQQRAGVGTLPERMFYLFPEEEAPDLGHIPTEQELGKTTHPEVSGAQIKKWIVDCRENHERCRGRQHYSGSGFIPKRLVAIGPTDLTRVRVVETKHSSIKGPYATLSHSWGTLDFMKLKVDNRIQFMEGGVALTALSKNFQEAIDVARSLDINYIWIDSLCIIQGDDGDFNLEGDLMDQVYRNSYCNIAAADSRDSRGGLFRDREADQILPTRYTAAGKSAVFGHRAWRILPEDLWDTHLLDMALYSRAWVFQERMLAPRIVHFAKNQIFWDCATMSACEVLPSGLPQPLDNVAGTDRHWRGRLQTSDSFQHRPLAGPADYSLEQFWKSAVRQYTSCDLTKGSDKLKAIWGIAKLVRNALNEEYGAGLWEKNLEEQLAWRVTECTLDERPKDLCDNPSWSWASMRGAIEVQDRLVEERCYVVKDHEGRRISFELVGKKRPTLEKRISEKWKEEIPAMDKDLARWKSALNRFEKDEGNSTKSAEQPQNTSTSKIVRNRQPELQSKSITIQGHIGRARLQHNILKRKWTLEIPVMADTVSDDAIFEVFPDVKPKFEDADDKNWYFVVLASSKVRQDNGVSYERDLETQQYEAEHVRYSGVGITLKPAMRKRHFYRTGALHLRDISAKMWACLKTTYCVEREFLDEYDVMNGLKFWLD